MALEVEHEEQEDIEVYFENPAEWSPTAEVRKGDEAELLGLLQRVVFEEATWSEVSSDARVISSRFTRRLKGLGVKSRLVIQDVRRSAAVGGELFAATPALATLRFQLAVGSWWLNVKSEFEDVTQAFPHAELEEMDNIYITLPREVHGWTLKVDEKDHTLNADNPYRLLRALYSYRRSPKLWQDFFADVIKHSDLKQSVIDCTLFFNIERCISLVLYVDDMLLLGRRSSVHEVVEYLKDEVKLKEVAWLSKPGNTAQMLGRQLERTDKGFKVTTGGKAVEQMIKEVSPDQMMKAVGCPSTRLTEKQEREAVLLDDAAAFLHRRLQGQVLYHGHDRPDIQFASKEIARNTAAPRNVDWWRLKRLLRYLAGRPSLTAVYEMTEKPTEILVWTDADWGGELPGRRCTSGGVMVIGSCYILSWARTQPAIALSSAETEYVALTIAAQEALLVHHLAAELDIVLEIHLLCDASAAIEMSARNGIARVRHFDLRVCFLKQLVHERRIILEKI